MILFRTSIGFDLFIRSTCGPLLYLMKENFNSIAKNYIAEKENNVKKFVQTDENFSMKFFF
jgi:hypothetical protein